MSHRLVLDVLGILELVDVEVLYKQTRSNKIHVVGGRLTNRIHMARTMYYCCESIVWVSYSSSNSSIGSSPVKTIERLPYECMC